MQCRRCSCHMIHGDRAGLPAASPQASQNVWDCSWWVPGNTIYWNTSISDTAEKQLCIVKITEFKGSQDVIAGSYCGTFVALIKDSCLLCYAQDPGLNRSLAPLRCTAKQSCLWESRCAWQSQTETWTTDVQRLDQWLKQKLKRSRVRATFQQCFHCLKRKNLLKHFKMCLFSYQIENQESMIKTICVDAQSHVHSQFFIKL